MYIYICTAAYIRRGCHFTQCVHLSDVYVFKIYNSSSAQTRIIHTVFSGNLWYRTSIKIWHFISPLTQYLHCVWPQDYIPTHNIVHKKVLLHWGKGNPWRFNPVSFPGTRSFKKCLLSSSFRILFFMTLLSFRGLGLNIIHSMAFQNLECHIIKDSQLQC